MRRVAMVLALALLATPGCFGPFRVHVDPAILAQAPGWVVTPAPQQGGFPGQQSVETRYTFDPNASQPQPPFPGTLQVFSLRGVDQMTVDQLLAKARDLVAQGAQEKSIALNDTDLEGGRTLDGGVRTRWFVREGTTTQAGALFGSDVGVRILGEVGRDGRSNTGLLVVAMAQVSRARTCGPILPTCTPGEESQATWIQMVGDRRGSIGGATSSSGFVDHLVTR